MAIIAARSDWRAAAAAVAAVSLTALAATYAVLSIRLPVLPGATEVPGAPSCAWFAALGAVGSAVQWRRVRRSSAAAVAAPAALLHAGIAIVLLAVAVAVAVGCLVDQALLAAAAAVAWAAPVPMAAGQCRRRRELRRGLATNSRGAGTSGSWQPLLANSQPGASGGGCRYYCEIVGLLLVLVIAALLFNGCRVYADGAATAYYRNPPGRFATITVAVADGRNGTTVQRPQRIFYNCSGPRADAASGRPAIFVDSDGSHGSPDFWPIQRALVALGYRTCVFDKPGLGFSDPYYTGQHVRHDHFVPAGPAHDVAPIHPATAALGVDAGTDSCPHTRNLTGASAPSQ